MSPCPANIGTTADDRAASDAKIRKNVFEELTVQEIINVRDYIYKVKDLNVTKLADASLSDNVIFAIEFLAPPKALALAFLDNKAKAPWRAARVVMFMGGRKIPEVWELKVWPTHAPTRHARLAIHQGSKSVPWASRCSTGVEDSLWNDLILRTAAPLKEEFKRAFDGWWMGPDCGEAEDDLCLTTTSNAPYGPGPDNRTVWLNTYRDLEGWILHSVGFQMRLDVSGTDPSKWKVIKLWFAGKYFDTVAQLKAAFKDDPKIKNVFLKAPVGSEADFSTFNPVNGSVKRPKEVRPGVYQLGPVAFEPHGKRFTLNRNLVSWMGWELQYGVQPLAGPRYWDVKFKGTRIAYEISFQEALASYGGDSPFQKNTFYLDSAWGLGNLNRPLINGIDCPLNAVYSDLTNLVDSEEPVVNKNSFCIFEFDTGMSVMRHYDDAFDGGYYFASGVKSYALVLRTIATCYNYDYYLDLYLYLDGSAETRVSLSGYVQAETFRDYNTNGKYGSPFWTSAMGTIHDHLVLWKVDLDVDGADNSFETWSVKMETSQDPNTDTPHISKYVERSVVEEEGPGARLGMDAMHPVQYTVVNPNRKNKWGEAKGYVVTPTKPTRTLLPPDLPLLKGAAWALHNIAVTKRQDDERWGSIPYNQFKMDVPALNFNDFFNKENITNTDIVVWVTSGVLHIPSSEDAPATPATTTSFGFTLRPHNFLDVNGAKDLRDTVVMLPDELGYPAPQAYVSDKTTQCSPSFADLPYNGTY